MTENARRLLREDGENPSQRNRDRALIFALIGIAEELRKIRRVIEGRASE